ncbi:hypothetical protein LguiA_008094 [Lonicera macranthoides]
MAGCALELNMLPEDCVSTILSLTSPLDACRSVLASSSLRFAAESDVVWEKFLPLDYQNILARSVTPLNFSSKKELFFALCHPILLDGGNKSFAIEKSCGRISYLLSARELSISQSNEPMHWTWKSTPQSRFSEVAELKTISRLEIQAKINTQILSPNTKYGAYLIIKISDRAFGLNSIPSEISVETSDRICYNTAYLRDQRNYEKQQMAMLFYNNRMQILKERVSEGDGRVPEEREDGWMEIELGEFFSNERDEEVKMRLMEVKGLQLKGGLIIEGIEVRPI